MIYYYYYYESSVLCNYDSSVLKCLLYCCAVDSENMKSKHAKYVDIELSNVHGNEILDGPSKYRCATKWFKESK